MPINKLNAHAFDTHNCRENPYADQSPSKARGSVLLLGNYRATQPLAHELSAVGFSVIAGITDAPEQAFAYSKYVHQHWFHTNPDKAADRFVAELNQFMSQRADVEYVMPVAEDVLVLLNQRRAQLIRQEAYVMMEPEIVATCLDKTRMLTFGAEIGLTQSPFVFVKSYAQLLAEADNLGFPLVVRPQDSGLKFGAQKAIIVASIDQLKQALPQWPKDHETLILQHEFSGKRYNHYFAAHHGRIIRSLQTVALRTDHADGTGLAVMGKTIDPIAGIAKDTKRFVEATNYNGIGCAQYLVDPTTGQHSFLEINPRIAGNHMLPMRAGLQLGPLFLALKKDLEFENISKMPQETENPNLTYIWTYGDLGGWARDVKKAQIHPKQALIWLFKALRDAVSANMHMTWTLKDPTPTLLNLAHKLRLFRAFKKPISKSNASMAHHQERLG